MTTTGIFACKQQDVIDIVESQKLQVKIRIGVGPRTSCGSYGYCGSSTNKSFDIKNMYRENGQLWILWIMWKLKKKVIS